MRRLVDIAASIALVGLLLLLWEGLCRALGTPVYFLPKPSDVALAFVQRWPLLLVSAWNTFAMSFVAFDAALVAGLVLAVLAGLSDLFARAVRPIAVTLQSTPVIAIAPMVVTWFGLDHAQGAVIALAAVVAFFPIFSGAVTGLASADPDLERLFDLYQAPRLQRLARLRAPAAVPFLLEGCKIGMGLAIIGAVVAEFVAGSGQTKGLAWRILESENRLRTADMIAAVLVLALLAVSLNLVIGLLEKQALRRWRGRPR